jgi:hypothetical protein
MSETIRLNNVMICFPHLFEKHAPPGTTRFTYGCEFLIDPIKQQQQCAEIDEVFKRVAIAAGKGDNLQFMKNPLQDGIQVNEASQAKGKKPREELIGMKLIRASDTKTAPSVVSARMAPIGEANKDQIFSGCIVNGFVDLYYSSNPTNPGVYCGLKGVQLVDNVNVERLDVGVVPVETMFGVVEGAPEPIAGTAAADPGETPAATSESWL